MRLLAICIFIIAYGCHPPEEEDIKIINAKWHYYSYACTLSGYTSDGQNVNPLECSVKSIQSIGNHNRDTVYIKSFYKNTTVECRFKPFNLDGLIIEREIYRPIFHIIKFDEPSNDSADYAYMQSQEEILIKKILEDKDRIDPWLYEEARRRGVIIDALSISPIKGAFF